MSDAKSGIQTSSFWVMMSTVLVGIFIQVAVTKGWIAADQAEQVKQMINDALAQLFGLVIAAVGVWQYIKGRAAVSVEKAKK